MYTYTYTYTRTRTSTRTLTRTPTRTLTLTRTLTRAHTLTLTATFLQVVHESLPLLPGTNFNFCMRPDTPPPIELRVQVACRGMAASGIANEIFYIYMYM